MPLSPDDEKWLNERLKTPEPTRQDKKPDKSNDVSSEDTGQSDYDKLSASAAFGKGALQGMAITATDLGRLAAHVVPQSWHDTVAGSRIGSAISDFADQDYGGIMQRLGSYTTQGLTFLIPGPGEVGGAAKVVSKAPEIAKAVEAAPRIGELAADELPGVAGGMGSLARQWGARGYETTSKMGEPVTELPGKFVGARGGAVMRGERNEPLTRVVGAASEGPWGTRPRLAARTLGWTQPRRAVPGAGMVLRAAETAPKAAEAPRVATTAERAANQNLYRSAGRQRAAQRAGRVAGLAAKGAVGGAMGDPDDPVTGAEVGAAGGLAGPALGAAMRSPIGQFIGRQLPGATLGELAVHAGRALGIPFHPTMGGLVLPLIHWYHSPVGRKLRWQGGRLFDQTGRLIGALPPGLAGYGAASTEANIFGGQGSQAPAE